MTGTFLPFAKPSITDEDIQTVAKSFGEPSLTERLFVDRFEETIAQYCGARYAVAFSSGTAAKMATYFAAGLSLPDWIITTPNTCITTVGPAIQTGNRIHLIDTDPKTGNMNLNLFKDKLKHHCTRGRPFIMACHFAGIPLDMQSIDSLICQPDAVVIEDASQAFGSSYRDGKRVGCCAFSQMTIFNFSIDKIITMGEGGVVTTNDLHLYRRLKIYRNNGIDPNNIKKPTEPWFHECQAITGNFAITNSQAALGLSQFKRLNAFLKQRQSLIHRYREKLKNLPSISLLSEELDDLSARDLCVVQIDFEALKTNKLTVINALNSKGIGTNVHYVPLYTQPLLGPYLEWVEEYPQNDIYYSRTLSLPLYHDLNFDEVDHICRELKSVLGMSNHALVS